MYSMAEKMCISVFALHGCTEYVSMYIIYIMYIDLYRYSAYTCKQKCIKHIAMTAMGAVLFAGPEAGAYLPSQLLNDFEACLSRITARWAGVPSGNLT